MSIENKLGRVMRDTGPARFLVPVGIILIIVGILFSVFNSKDYKQAEGIVTERGEYGLLFKGFRKPALPPSKPAEYAVEHSVELKGDFTAMMEVDWTLPSNAMPEFLLQLYTAEGKLVAETGLLDAWLAMCARAAGWVGPVRKGGAFWLADKGHESFIITREGDRIAIHCGSWKLDEQNGTAEAVTGIRLLVRQHLVYDKDNITLLSRFGDITLCRIEVADKALPPPPPRVAPIQRAPNWHLEAPIVGYWAGPQITDEFAKQLKEGGWNFAWGMTVSDLDIMHKYGLRGLMWVTVPATSSPENDQRLRWWLDSFRNHPAILGVHCGDEPGGARMDSAARGVGFFMKEAPELLHFNNMYPINASNKQLAHEGTPQEAYQAHIKEYFEKLHPQLLSYDKYNLWHDGDDGAFFLNQAIIRKAALEHGVPSMNILQGCSWTPGIRVPNGDEYRYLVFCSLAYGSKGIMNYVYGHPRHWGSALDIETGRTTPLYDAMKSINREFTAIATELMPLTSLAVWHAGEIPFGTDAHPENASVQFLPKLTNVSQGLEDATINYAQGNNYFNRRPPVKGFLTGCFGKEGMVSHVLVVNLDYKHAVNAVLEAPAPLEAFATDTRQWSPVAAGNKLSIMPGGGILLRYAGGKAFPLLKGNATTPIVVVEEKPAAQPEQEQATAYAADFTKGVLPAEWRSGYTKGCEGLDYTLDASGLSINGLKKAEGAEAEAHLSASIPPIAGDFSVHIEYDVPADVQNAANELIFKFDLPNGENLIQASVEGGKVAKGLPGWNARVHSRRDWEIRHLSHKDFTITRRGDLYNVQAGILHGCLVCAGDTSPIAAITIIARGVNARLLIKRITISKLE